MAQLIFGGASFAAPIFLSYLILKINDNEPSAAKSIFIKIVPVDLPWISLYWIFSLILLLMVFITLVSKFPEVRRKEDEKSGTWSAHKSLFKQKIIILYFFGIFSYVGTEQGVSYWLSEFLHRYYGYDPITAGAPVVGWFWGMMSVGCLFGLLFLKLFDARKILMGAVISAAAFLSLSLFTNGRIALITFPLVGFSLSVMWSIIFSLALNSVERHHGSFAGILCTAIIGGAVIQLFIGWLGDLFGLRAGMSFVYITLSYIFFIGIWANPIITNETIKLKDLVSKKKFSEHIE
jgi:fucose permease